LKCPLGAEEDTAGDGAVEFNGEEVRNMPGLDRTGPVGAGPMTGGGFGRCNSRNRAYGWGSFGAGRGGRGPGWGRGYGRGFGRRGASFGGQGWYGPAYGPYAGPYSASREDEISVLKEEAEMMKSELEAIHKRIGELGSEPLKTA
jgi:Family of unknown function (DUF5320)